jgi:ADP-ribosylglycohydrolase
MMAYLKTSYEVSVFVGKRNLLKQEDFELFGSLFRRELPLNDVDTINSIHHAHLTIRAAMYCFLNTNSYTEAVLMAVNLGDDTDTTASVAGALAGIYYGFDSIPVKWRNEIRRSNDISDLCNRLAAAMNIQKNY